MVEKLERKITVKFEFSSKSGRPVLIFSSQDRICVKHTHRYVLGGFNETTFTFNHNRVIKRPKLSVYKQLYKMETGAKECYCRTVLVSAFHHHQLKGKNKVRINHKNHKEPKCRYLSRRFVVSIYDVFIQFELIYFTGASYKTSDACITFFCK